MSEIWIGVPNCEKVYQVSSLGRVKSLKYGKERILKPYVNKGGYLRVNLHLNGKNKHYLVALLVWSAFNGPIPEGMQINHINEDKTDNRLENLNLMTPKENSNWGTRTSRQTQKMINGKTSKRVFQYDLEGNLIKEWESAHQVERETAFSFQNISACCLGKCKTIGGYVWRYN